MAIFALIICDIEREINCLCQPKTVLSWFEPRVLTRKTDRSPFGRGGHEEGRFFLTRLAFDHYNEQVAAIDQRRIWSMPGYVKYAAGLTPEDRPGEVSEWFMVPLSKSGLASRRAWVRIPPSPPERQWRIDIRQ